jgi:hypothetical protein
MSLPLQVIDVLKELVQCQHIQKLWKDVYLYLQEYSDIPSAHVVHQLLCSIKWHGSIQGFKAQAPICATSALLGRHWLSDSLLQMCIEMLTGDLPTTSLLNLADVQLSESIRHTYQSHQKGILNSYEKSWSYRAGEEVKRGKRLLSLANVNNNHWIGWSVNPTERTICYWDSLGGGIPRALHPALVWWLEKHGMTGFIVSSLPTLIQKDSFNCGIIALNMLLHLLKEGFHKLTDNDQLVLERLSAAAGILERHLDAVNDLDNFLGSIDNDNEEDDDNVDDTTSIVIGDDTEIKIEVIDQSTGIGGENRDKGDGRYTYDDDAFKYEDEEELAKEPEWKQADASIGDNNDPHKNGRVERASSQLEESGHISAQPMRKNNTLTNFRQTTLSFKRLTTEELAAKCECDRQRALEFRQQAEEAAAAREQVKLQQTMLHKVKVQQQGAARQRRWRARKVEEEKQAGLRDQTGKKLKKKVRICGQKKLKWKLTIGLKDHKSGGASCRPCCSIC